MIVLLLCTENTRKVAERISSFYKPGAPRFPGGGGGGGLKFMPQQSCVIFFSLFVIELAANNRHTSDED